MHSAEEKRAAATVRLLERRVARFFREPPSVRAAAGVIVTATALVVVGAGVLIRILDPHEYSSIWTGMWWALQTVTTVGYGDVTPARLAGRVVAAFVMLEGIAFLAIVTAAITSTFIARATRELEARQARDGLTVRKEIEARFTALERKLDRIEAALPTSAGGVARPEQVGGGERQAAAEGGVDQPVPGPGPDRS